MQGKLPNAVFINRKEWEILKAEADASLRISADYSKKVFGIDIYVSEDIKEIRVGEIFF